MSQPKGSLGVALTIVILILIAVTSVGYYQFVYCQSGSVSCTAAQETTTASGPSCTPPKCVTIVINPGAAALTTTAYSPDTARLIVGVNNTFQVFNNDSQSGGVAHTLTAKTCPQTCPFDSGIIAYNGTSKPFTITVPGTYPYYCVVHPSTMIGTIIVVAGSGAPPPPSTSSLSSSSSTTSTTTNPGAATGVKVSMPKGANSPNGAPGYSPDSITVVVGKNNTITFSNDDSSPHTVTSDTIPSGAATFNSGIMAPGDIYSLTLTVPGNYVYICTLHSWMKGTITVKSG